MSRRVYGKAIIDELRNAHRSDSAGAIANAIDFLRANLTDAAIHGCHHCGEQDDPGAPCRWCGLRDKPRRIKPTMPAALRSQESE